MEWIAFRSIMTMTTTSISLVTQIITKFDDSKFTFYSLIFHFIMISLYRKVQQNCVLMTLKLKIKFTTISWDSWIVKLKDLHHHCIDFYLELRDFRFHCELASHFQMFYFLFSSFAILIFFITGCNSSRESEIHFDNILDLRQCKMQCNLPWPQQLRSTIFSRSDWEMRNEKCFIFNF